LLKTFGRWIASVIKDSISKSVSALVIAALGALATAHWWSAITNAVASCEKWVRAEVVIDRWQLILLQLCAATLCGVVLFFLWLALSSKTKLTNKDYWEDRFHGLIWQWHLDSNYNISRLVPLCEECLSEVRSEHLYVAPARMSFTCLHCGHKSDSIRGDADYQIAEGVKVQIRRKLRSGEWFEAVKAMNKKSPTTR